MFVLLQRIFSWLIKVGPNHCVYFYDISLLMPFYFLTYRPTKYRESIVIIQK